MGAPLNNDFYKYRKTDGAPIKYNADYIINKWNEFVDVCNDSIHYRNELIKSGDKAGDIVRVPFQTPLTKIGFCLFAKIDKNTFDSYCDSENDKIDKDLFTICTHVSDSIMSYIDNGCLTGALLPAYGARMTGRNETINLNNQDQPSININIDGKLMNLTK